MFNFKPCQTERRRQSGRGTFTHFLLCASAICGVAAFARTTARSEQSSVQTIMRSLRKHVALTSVVSTRKAIFNRKAEGRPIPVTITPDSTSSLTYNVGSDTTSASHDYVWVDISVRTAYTAPGFVPGTPPTPTSQNGWPYQLFYTPTTKSAPVRLTPVIPGNMPSVSIMAAPYDTPTQPTVRVSTVSQDSYNAIEANGIFVTLSGAADADLLLYGVAFDPVSVAGGQDAQCTVTLTRAVTREDERTGRNIFWVDCDNHILIQPRQGEWPYKKLHFHRGDLSATFTVKTRQLPDSDPPYRLCEVYAYAKYGNPLQPPVYTNLIVTKP